jgi:hypothetical protein
MGNFSKDPFDELRRSREQGYVGLHVEQGVPLLDRDLNLLADLVSSTVREILARHLGSGVAERNVAFAIEGAAAENDLRIAAPPGRGACLVGGIQVTIDAPLTYREQGDVPPLTTPERDRDDVVYLDVWVEEVDASADAALANDVDIAMQTSVRLRPAWRVRVAEDAREAPVPEAGHAHCPLARLERPRGERVIRDETIVDLRRTGLNLGDLARRVERIESVLFAASRDAARPELVLVGGASTPVDPIPARGGAAR